MSDEDMIPTSYAQWRHCIEDLGGVQLTSSYIRDRLDELEDETHAKTKEFTRIYGADHLARITSWFHRAADEMPGQPGRIRHA